MSSRKSKKKYHQLVASEVCLEHVQAICWRSCLKFVLSSRFWFYAQLACFNEIHQNVNDLVFRDRVEKGPFETSHFTCAESNANERKE